MTKQEAAQAYLRRDPVLYANLLEALRRGSAELLEAGEGGVLLYERGCGAYMMSAASPAAAGRAPSRTQAAISRAAIEGFPWQESSAISSPV